MKRTTKKRRAAKEQADRFLGLHVKEARAKVRSRIAAAARALEELAIAEDELLARWSAFVLTRPEVRQ